MQTPTQGKHYTLALCMGSLHHFIPRYPIPKII